MIAIAHGAYYDYYPHKFAGDPTVCIQKPKDWKDFYDHGIGLGSLYTGVKDWQTELNNYTHAKNFKIKILYDASGCDIDIKLEKFGTVYGTTKCEIGRCNIIIYLNQPANEIKNTITHEIGHALGLGHILPFNMCDFAGIIIEGDIMMPTANKFQRITKNSLDAMINLYGVDGFQEPNHFDRESYVVNYAPKCKMS